MAGGALRGRSHTIAGGGLSALGLASEADNAVQEAWLWLSRADTCDVEHLSGWLTMVVARTARDTVSRNARAKLYVMSASASASDPATMSPPILWPGMVHRTCHALSQQRAALMASARRAVGRGNDTYVSSITWPGLRSWPLPAEAPAAQRRRADITPEPAAVLRLSKPHRPTRA